MGVLALQGDFREHVQVFAELGVDARLVKQPRELQGLTHLVIPGGESTTISMLAQSSGLVGPIAEMIKDGCAFFGTCAGMILLCAEILDGREDQIAFGAIDITVRRNGFGRQVNSFEAALEIEGIDGPPMVAAFIRAPVVTRVGAGVEVISQVAYEFGNGKVDTVPAVCRTANVLVSSFHPEVTGDVRLHKLFVKDFKVGS